MPNVRTFKCPIQVRFVDIDSLGHVNNAVYLSYFEMARVAFMNQFVGTHWDWYSKGMLLKTNTVEYLQPVFLHEKVEVEIVPLSVKNTSFVLEYNLFADGVLKSKGSSVLVCYDFKNKKKNPVYGEFRKIFD